MFPRIRFNCLAERTGDVVLMVKVFGLFSQNLLAVGMLSESNHINRSWRIGTSSRAWVPKFSIPLYYPSFMENIGFHFKSSREIIHFVIPKPETIWQNLVLNHFVLRLNVAIQPNIAVPP